MTGKTASCTCGQLRITCEGEPVRISMCHCFACQRRTGSVFGVQARFPRTQVKMEGKATRFTRTADSGNTVTYSFCPKCGSTVFWELSGFPDLIAVGIGFFEDPSFPPPRHSVFEGNRHSWAMNPAGLTMEHLA
jgi:hypothetical protein